MYTRQIKYFFLLSAHPLCANGFSLPHIFLFPEINVFSYGRKKKVGKIWDLTDTKWGRKYLCGTNAVSWDLYEYPTLVWKREDVTLILRLTQAILEVEHAYMEGWLHKTK